jgi:hypothetical protein
MSNLFCSHFSKVIVQIPAPRQRSRLFILSASGSHSVAHVIHERFRSHIISIGKLKYSAYHTRVQHLKCRTELVLLFSKWSSTDTPAIRFSILLWWKKLWSFPVVAIVICVYTTTSTTHPYHSSHLASSCLWYVHLLHVMHPLFQGRVLSGPKYRGWSSKHHWCTSHYLTHVNIMVWTGEEEALFDTIYFCT